MTQETLSLKNPTQNAVKKLFPRLFSKISKLNISLNQ